MAKYGMCSPFSIAPLVSSRIDFGTNTAANLQPTLLEHTRESSEGAGGRKMADYSDAHRLSVAPMMAVTDRYFR